MAPSIGRLLALWILCALCASLATAADPSRVYDPTLQAWIEPSSRGVSLWSAPRPPDGPEVDSGTLGQVTVLQAFPFPASNWLYARGAAWDGTSLWISENATSRTYEIDPTTGGVLSSFFGPESNHWGLTFDGSALISGAISRSGPPPDNLPDDVYVLSTNGGVFTSWLAPDSPNANPHGCAFDPGTGSLWLSDSEADVIYELTPGDGTRRARFVSPSPDMRGLAFDGRFLWGIDHAGLSLMQFDLSGNVLGQLSIAALGNDPEGLTSDGAYLWITENETDTIYQVNVGLEIFTDGFESGDTAAWSNTVP